MAESILIVKPSSLGDIIHTLPLLNALKHANPQAEVDWVLARGFEDILRGHPMIRKIFVIDKDRWKRPSSLFKTLKEIANLSRELRKQKYSTCIDVQGLFRSALITILSGAERRIGFSDAREGAPLFYNEKVEGGRGIHAVDRYLKLLNPFGIKPDEVEFPLPPVEEIRPVQGRYYVIIPGARWQTKIWPSEYYAQLVRLISKKLSLSGLTPVIAGSKAERPIAEKIMKLSKGVPVDLTGKTSLRELISIIRGASFVITNDSGPMHIASAVKIPVIAIFGPTSPKLTGPYGEEHIVLSAGLSCQPCFKKVCKDVRCLKEVRPEMVFEKLLSINLS